MWNSGNKTEDHREGKEKQKMKIIERKTMRDPEI